jgi:hypothetical protein
MFGSETTGGKKAVKRTQFLIRCHLDYFPWNTFLFQKDMLTLLSQNPLLSEGNVAQDFQSLFFMNQPQKDTGEYRNFLVKFSFKLLEIFEKEWESGVSEPQLMEL